MQAVNASLFFVRIIMSHIFRIMHLVRISCGHDILSPALSPVLVLTDRPRRGVYLLLPSICCNLPRDFRDSRVIIDSMMWMLRHRVVFAQTTHGPDLNSYEGTGYPSFAGR